MNSSRAVFAAYLLVIVVGVSYAVVIGLLGR
ncbi:MAG: hypothetical protein JWR62_2118 [Modestobacter sp.]|jgi:hypothetical protein|nr:hypothetical protein [Modestobacter sp.]